MSKTGKIHLLFLTDNFPPEVNAPASRTFEHCREWVASGHSITVVTCFPNFPSGKIHSGYKNRLFALEELEGIHVIRVKTFISANEGTLLRTLDYLSYMFAGFLASLFVRKVDLVIGTSPQFFTAIAAYLTALVKRVPWVFELRDLWPESIRALGVIETSLGSRALDLLEKVELFLYRKANLIVCVTESFRRNLISRSIEPSKISVITNGVDLNFFQPQSSKDVDLLTKLDLKGKFVAGYMGTIGLAHSLETLVEAAKELQNQPKGEGISIVIIGDGAKKHEIRELIDIQDLRNILLLDSIPKKAVPSYLSLFDVSIIHLAKKDLFKTVIPSKLFETMAAGIPVVYGVEGESREVVLEHSVGVIFEPENSKELAQLLVKLKGDEAQLGQLKSNALHAARHFSRSTLANRMLELLEGLVHIKNQ